MFLFLPRLLQDTEGYVLPDWTKEVYPEAMRDMMTEMYNVYVADNDELVKLVIGEFYLFTVLHM